jgi:hypothetical protein
MVAIPMQTNEFSSTSPDGQPIAYYRWGNPGSSHAFPRPTLNTWIVIIQIFILLIAIFMIELHLRKVEHRSLSLVRLEMSENCLEV